VKVGVPQLIKEKKRKFPSTNIGIELKHMAGTRCMSPTPATF
jgi:hypothetical protein